VPRREQGLDSSAAATLDAGGGGKLMSMDLFDLIDRFFGGVLDFIFNMLDSMLKVLRHPVKAPVALYLDHRNKRFRQVSGLSFLFGSFFFILAVWPSVLEWDETKKAGHAIFHNLEVSKTLWPLLSTSVVCTVIVDTALRLVLRITTPTRRFRRDAVRAIVEYALFLPLLTALLAVPVLFVVIILLLSGIDSQTGSTVAMLTAPLIFLAAFGASLVPAAAILCGGTPRPEGMAEAQGVRRRRRRRRLVTLYAILLGAILFGSLGCGIAYWADSAS
jgi:hypothetical protein